VFQLPYQTVGRPVGPGYGVCEAQVGALCDGAYATWQDMTDAGLDWVDVLAGAAAASPPVVFGRTFGEVDIEFADFAAVAANGTFGDLLSGA
jgi:hypothetical protein